MVLIATVSRDRAFMFPSRGRRSRALPSARGIHALRAERDGLLGAQHPAHGDDLGPDQSGGRHHLFHAPRLLGEFGDTPDGAVRTWSATSPARSWSADSLSPVVCAKTTVDEKETASTERGDRAGQPDHVGPGVGRREVAGDTGPVQQRGKEAYGGTGDQRAEDGDRDDEDEDEEVGEPDEGEEVGVLCQSGDEIPADSTSSTPPVIRRPRPSPGVSTAASPSASVGRIPGRAMRGGHHRDQRGGPRTVTSTAARKAGG